MIDMIFILQLGESWKKTFSVDREVYSASFFIAVGEENK